VHGKHLVLYFERYKNTIESERKNKKSRKVLKDMRLGKLHVKSKRHCKHSSLIHLLESVVKPREGRQAEGGGDQGRHCTETRHPNLPIGGQNPLHHPCAQRPNPSAAAASTAAAAVGVSVTVAIVSTGLIRRRR